MLLAWPTPAASAGELSSASSQRPVSMYAHPSTVRPPAGTAHAGSAESPHGVLQHGDRQAGLVQQPRGGRYTPPRRLVDGRADDRAQGRQELVSAADRVGAGGYPESQHVDVYPRDLAGVCGSWPSSRARVRSTAWWPAGAPDW